MFQCSTVVQQCLAKIQSILLPCPCVCCGANSGNELLCEGCKADLPWLTRVCVSCSVPLYNAPTSDLSCGDCLKNPPPFDQVIALFSYEFPINHLIHQLKFAKKLTIARVMGEGLLQKIQEQNTEKKPELIIPMPLHPQRLKERGFNQAHEIARIIAKPLKIPMNTSAIIRHKNTAEQASLPFSERKKNLSQAFLLREKITAKHVAIIDDVMTTGYTVRALADLLKAQGVERVDIWCCARTGLDI